jgi:hypothetical protein
VNAITMMNESSLLDDFLCSVEIRRSLVLLLVHLTSRLPLACPLV